MCNRKQRQDMTILSPRHILWCSFVQAVSRIVDAFTLTTDLTQTRQLLRVRVPARPPHAQIRRDRDMQRVDRSE